MEITSVYEKNKAMLKFINDSETDVYTIKKNELYFTLKAANDIIVELDRMLNLIANTIQKSQEWRDSLNENNDTL
jgi:hypothetical protein